ncbi:MAG: DUF456 domain-containing protein [Candidatus Eisenbacteria bacterium]|nr:DUF456 domain-containing protein [Candidatus Eisenbacteria bacterium]
MAELGQVALRVLLLVLLDAVLLAGLLAIPLGLSGNFILLGVALLVAVVTRFHLIGIAALLVMAALVAAGEILEAFLGSVMTRKYGGTRWGMIGAFAGGMVGAVLGTPLFPVLGTVVGSFAGTALGALAAEFLGGARGSETVRAGCGALLGRVLASAIKLSIGIGIAVYTIVRTHAGAG